MFGIDKTIRDLEEQRDKLDAALRVLRGLSGGHQGSGTRVLSEAGRQRIIAAQRKRWAKARAAKKKG